MIKFLLSYFRLLNYLRVKIFRFIFMVLLSKRATKLNKLSIAEYALALVNAYLSQPNKTKTKRK